MEYIKVKWLHSDLNEPILLYSEFSRDRWEVRKVEVFEDGRVGFACENEAMSSTGTKLSLEPLPAFHEIASDPQFQPVEISKDEFEAIWQMSISQG